MAEWYIYRIRILTRDRTDNFWSYSIL